MYKNFQTANKIEKVLEENPLVIRLESKVIIKNNNEKIEFDLSQISNIRIIKKRNLIINITLFSIAVVFYLNIMELKNVGSLLMYLSLLVFSFLLVIAYWFKSYTYTLLINKGLFGFKEISLSKNNIQYAENFMSKFKINSLTKAVHDEFEYQKLKQCL